MTNQKQPYDWAQALFALANTQTSDFGELVKAAHLDPRAEDLSDVDLSGLDLSGQDLSGWNLKYAKFANATLTGTKLRDATLNVCELIQAVDWEGADLDEKTRIVAAEFTRLSFNPLFLKEVSELGLTTRTHRLIKNDNIVYLGDLVQKTEAEMLRTEGLGRKSLNEIKEELVQYAMHLGMEVRGWPPENIEELSRLFKEQSQ
jgi:uncharacterized protein YjbI with pentapeptide repeats